MTLLLLSLLLQEQASAACHHRCRSRQRAWPLRRRPAPVQAAGVSCPPPPPAGHPPHLPPLPPPLPPQWPAAGPRPWPGLQERRARRAYRVPLVAQVAPGPAPQPLPGSGGCLPLQTPRPSAPRSASLQHPRTPPVQPVACGGAAWGGAGSHWAAGVGPPPAPASTESGDWGAGVMPWGQLPPATRLGPAPPPPRPHPHHAHLRHQESHERAAAVGPLPAPGCWREGCRVQAPVGAGPPWWALWKPPAPHRPHAATAAPRPDPSHFPAHQGTVATACRRPTCCGRRLARPHWGRRRGGPKHPARAPRPHRRTRCTARAR